VCSFLIVDRQSLFVILFGSLILAGECVKCVYFYLHLGKDFVVPDTKPVVLYGLVGYFMANYVVLVVVASVYFVG